MWEGQEGASLVAIPRTFSSSSWAAEAVPWMSAFDEFGGEALQRNFYASFPQGTGNGNDGDGPLKILDMAVGSDGR